MLNSKQRAFLRSLGNSVDSIINIGKAGVTPDTTISVDEALEKRELIKITVLNNCSVELKEVANVVSDRTHSDIVQIVGRKFLLYRKAKKNPKIELPK